MNLSLATRFIDCSGEILGSIAANSSGGVLPHVYSWNGPDGFQSVSDSIFGLDFGTYYVTVTDLNSCYLTDSSVMDQDPTLVLEIVVNNPISCNGYSDGILEINTSQGLEPYNYDWNNFTFT